MAEEGWEVDEAHAAAMSVRTMQVLGDSSVALVGVTRSSIEDRQIRTVPKAALGTGVLHLLQSSDHAGLIAAASHCTRRS
eukprot:1389505-Amphidinium_carterae.1